MIIVIIIIIIIPAITAAQHTVPVHLQGVTSY